MIRVTLYDGGIVLADLDSAGNREAEYVYDQGTDRPYAMLTGSTTVTAERFYAQDDMGNVDGLFRDYATVTETVTYGDWGLPSVTGDTTNRFTWKGLSYDPDVGLTYVRSRWYDPNIGRFVSEDPIGLAGGINPYVFGNNDPINGFDPSGTTAYISTSDKSRCQYSYTIGDSDLYFETGGCDFGGGGGDTDPFGNDSAWTPNDPGIDRDGPQGSAVAGGGERGLPAKPNSTTQRNSRSACVENALAKNWKGLALDAVGLAANVILPEATLGKVVVGSALGITGIGLAVTDNTGPADGGISVTLALTGKEAALAEGGMRGAAVAVGKRVGLASLYFSIAYDVGKSAYAYSSCRSAH